MNFAKFWCLFHKSAKVGSGSRSLIGYFPGSGSGSKILDVPFEDPEPSLIISDPENCSVRIWRIPPHTQYETDLLHSNPAFLSTLRMRGNSSYFYWVCRGISPIHTEYAEELFIFILSMRRKSFWDFFYFGLIKPPLTHLRRPMWEKSFLGSF